MSRAPRFASPRRRTIAALTAVVVVGGLAASISPAATAASSSATKVTAKPAATSKQAWTSGRYIVLLGGLPAASYSGGIAGYKATKPAAGK